jgi:hypothetical protein
MARPIRTAFDRAFPRLIQSPDGCWIWPGAVSYKDGYGTVAEVVDGKWTIRVVHRVVWEKLRGPIPDGMELDHVKELCSSRLCANPDHLEVVTHAENMRRVAGEECKAGHPRNEENTGINSLGARFCRPCARQAQKRFRERRLAERAELRVLT